MLNSNCCGKSEISEEYASSNARYLDLPSFWGTSKPSTFSFILAKWKRNSSGGQNLFCLKLAGKFLLSQ